MRSYNSRDLARQVLVLSEIANVRTYQDHNDVNMQWVDFGDYEPEETFGISLEGGVTRHTCLYSGHNGDSYDDKCEVLSAKDAIKTMQKLISSLEWLCFERGESYLEKAAFQRRVNKAKSNLNALLKSKRNS